MVNKNGLDPRHKAHRKRQCCNVAGVGLRFQRAVSGRLWSIRKSSLRMQAGTCDNDRRNPMRTC